MAFWRQMHCPCFLTLDPRRQRGAASALRCGEKVEAEEESPASHSELEYAALPHEDSGSAIDEKNPKLTIFGLQPSGLETSKCDLRGAVA